MAPKEIDRLGKKCKCGGEFYEAELQDSWIGRLTCKKCRRNTDRYRPVKKPKAK